MPFPSTTTIDKRPNIFFATLEQDLAEGGSETEILLSTITTLDGTVLTTADISFFGRCILTIAPQSASAIEFAEFTGFSTPDISITGVTRGLSFNSNDIVPNNVKYHSSGTPVIISFGTHDFIDIQDALVTLLNLINSSIESGGVLASNTVIGITELTAIVGYTVGTCTISIASPAVITKSSHGLSIGNVVQFTTSGTLPTGIVAGTNYYIISSGFTANSFEISTTPTGTAISTTGTQSGIQTLLNQTPRALGENDARVPTANEVLALPGNNIDIPVGSGNKYVTQTGLQHNAEKYAPDTSGSSTAYVITLSPVPTSLTAGMIVYVKIVNANTTTTPTLNVNGLGAITIVKIVNTALAVGDISANQFCTFEYDGTNFVLTSPVANVAAAPTYTVNADETLNTYYTQHLPLIFTSSTLVGGWSNTNLSASTISVTYLFLVNGGGGSGEVLSTLMPGTGTDTTFNIATNKAIRVKGRFNLATTTDIFGWGFCASGAPANIYTAQTDTTNAEIRFVVNGSVIYAQSANGTATAVNVSSGIVLTQWNSYEIIFTPGVSAKFYINGVLVATITTNLPTTGTLCFALGSNTNKQFYITPPVISIQL